VNERVDEEAERGRTDERPEICPRLQKWCLVAEDTPIYQDLGRDLWTTAARCAVALLPRDSLVKKVILALLCALSRCVELSW
jgi:hypothetical protein